MILREWTGRWAGVAYKARGPLQRSREVVDIELQADPDGGLRLVDHSREALGGHSVKLTPSESGFIGRWQRRTASAVEVVLTPAGQNIDMVLSGVGMTGLETLEVHLCHAEQPTKPPRHRQERGVSLEDQITHYIRRTETGSPSDFMTTSVLVAVEGELAAECYYWGQRPEDAHIISSCTKSITGLLAGISLEEFSIDPNTLVDDLLREDLQAGPWREAGITLSHLLDMTAGTAWRGDSDSQDSLQLLLTEDIEAFSVRHLPSNPPGWSYRYDNSLPALLGVLLARIVDEPLDSYAQRKLFSPIGIDGAWWTQTIADGPLSAGGMYMRPRDMIRIGQLVLQNGRWSGLQVVPESWIARSSSSRTVQGDYPYSSYWHLNRPDHRHFGDADALLALGQGGQVIAVIPSLDAVVVTTSENWRWSGHDALPMTLIDQIIWPALTQKA